MVISSGKFLSGCLDWCFVYQQIRVIFKRFQVLAIFKSGKRIPRIKLVFYFAITRRGASVRVFWFAGVVFLYFKQAAQPTRQVAEKCVEQEKKAARLKELFNSFVIVLSSLSK